MAEWQPFLIYSVFSKDYITGVIRYEQHTVAASSERRREQIIFIGIGQITSAYRLSSTYWLAGALPIVCSTVTATHYRLCYICVVAAVMSRRAP